MLLRYDVSTLRGPWRLRRRTDSNNRKIRGSPRLTSYAKVLELPCRLNLPCNAVELSLIPAPQLGGFVKIRDVSKRMHGTYPNFLNPRGAGKRNSRKVSIENTFVSDSRRLRE